MAVEPILVLKVQDNRRIAPQALLKAAAKSGRSPYGLVFEMARRALPPQRMLPDLFMACELWRPELTAVQKSQFVGISSSHKLNRKLTTSGPDCQNNLLRNKLLTSALLESCGVQTPRILGVFAKEAAFGSVPMVRDRESLTKFLSDPANHPCFCKPVEGSRANGSVWIKAVAHDGKLILGNGREVEATDLADEVVANFPRGWMIQEFVRPMAAISDVTGPALASMRVVTIWPKGQPPKVMYCGIRLPGIGAQNDSIAGAGYGLALVDHTRGIITHVKVNGKGFGEAVTKAPAAQTDEPILGFEIPRFQELVQKLCDVHQMFPGHGLLGFDATITDQGPLVTEINSSPFHTLFQRTTGQPFATPEWMAELDDVAEGVRLRANAKTKGWKTLWK